jgi:3'(2'), 5'-bisphosphate nucleotidase
VRTDPLTAELEAARELARRAGAEVLRHYGSTESETKAGGSPVTTADLAANDIIRAGLSERFPGDAILSEESRDDASRLEARRVWIVDPLDGTKDFLARNGEFSIMIGLVVAGRPALGVVYLPDGDVMYSAAAGSGAWVRRNGATERLERAVADPAGLRLVGSRSHAEPLLTRVQEALGITDVEPCGSVGVKCARIAEGRRDLYAHPVPYLKEWDTCAPEVILAEAGGRVTDCLGGPLRYNKPDPTQPLGILARAPGCEEALERARPIFEAAFAK